MENESENSTVESHNEVFRNQLSDYLVEQLNAMLRNQLSDGLLIVDIKKRDYEICQFIELIETKNHVYGLLQVHQQREEQQHQTIEVIRHKGRGYFASSARAAAANAAESVANVQAGNDALRHQHPHHLSKERVPHSNHRANLVAIWPSAKSNSTHDRPWPPIHSVFYKIPRGAAIYSKIKTLSLFAAHRRYLLRFYLR